MYNNKSFEQLKGLIILARNANMIFDKLYEDTVTELLEFGIDISNDVRTMTDFESEIESLINDYCFEPDLYSAEVALNKLIKEIKEYTIKR